MFGHVMTRRLAATVAATLVAGLLLPASLTAAQTAESSTHKHSLPVLQTVPAANSATVRPDTAIEVQLDPASADYDKWDRKFRTGATLTLINDGGAAKYDLQDSELHYDAATGKLRFTPPEPLNRYTTYGVVVTPEPLTAAQRKDPARKQLPQQPPLKVVPRDKATLHSKLQHQADEIRINGERVPSVVEQPQLLAPAPGMPALFERLESQETQRLQLLQVAARHDQVGPDPVRAIDGALKPIDRANGEQQTGIIERIEGAQVTLFGGTQFTVDADTHIHRPGAGQETLADLRTGDFVKVTVNAHSQVQNVHVTTPRDVVSFVFQTGSALHEPTHVELAKYESEPRVTENGQLTLVSKDDYGQPAWGSEVQVELMTLDQTPLDASAAVLPAATFTTSDPTGRTDVTIVDHKPQQVAAKISLNGPYYDGYDAHGLVAMLTFRPGLPAQIDWQTPQQQVVGTQAAITGRVTDLYGNPVEDPSELRVSATAGAVQSPVFTKNGAFATVYTAATKVQAVTLQVAAVQGKAQAQANVQLLPDVPAAMTFDVPAKLTAGETTSLRGTVADQYGNPVADGTALLYSASAGTLPAQGETKNGAFEAPYTAPTKVQTVSLAAATAQGQANAERLVEIVPGPAAHISLQAAKTTVLAGSTTDLSGQVADQYDNPLAGQGVELRAQHGTLTPPAAATDAQGAYRAQYGAPTTYTGLDRVTATAGQATTAIDLNVEAAGGTGYNPITRRTEPVASIRFTSTTVETTLNQTVTLRGTAYNARNQILQNVVLTAAETTLGTIKSISPMTDANGAFTVVFQSNDQQGTAVVTVGSATIFGSTNVVVSRYGWGFNQATGLWEKVSSITLDQQVVVGVNRSYNLRYRPDQQVEFTGTARNAQNQPLQQVEFNLLSATAGTLEMTQSPTATGQFKLLYTAPSTEGNQIVQIGSGLNNVTTLFVAIDRLGQGYNPDTRNWDEIASIVFNPQSYTVPSSQMVRLTGTVYNAAGRQLTLAKLLVSPTGGTVTNQVVTGLDGTFSMEYIAPAVEADTTYTVRAHVNGTVSGSATVRVIAPPPPYYDPSFFLQLWTPRYGSDYVEYRGYAYWGDGRPMTPANLGGSYFRLEKGFDWTLKDYIMPDYNGYLAGTGPGEYRWTWISYDRYGYTINYSYYFMLTRITPDLHHASPMISKSWHIQRWYRN